MSPRSIGDVANDGDFNESLVTRADLNASDWHDPVGDRGRRYISLDSAVKSALRSGIQHTMIVVLEIDGTYSLSIQYDHFA